MVNKLLSGLSNCTEWTQLALLKSLLEYDTDDVAQIENILDRMLSRLSHINPAVVFYSSKVIIKFAHKLQDETLYRGVLRKLSSPFVSLMSGEPEFVYVLLKNFLVLVKVSGSNRQEFPLIFQDAKIFFINPSEPLYIKKEKVRFLFELCSDKNHKVIISELLEYCYDPSPELSRLSLEMLWRIPLKIELGLPSILKIFQKILNESQSNSFINHLFDETCIGMHFIHRKFKSRAYFASHLLDIVLQNWLKISTAEAKCGFIYFLNKFGSKQREKLAERIEALVDDFENEEDEVQLAILGAVMKASLDLPNRLGPVVQKVFCFCSESSPNPDLRGRAFVYRRLISTRQSNSRSQSRHCPEAVFDRGQEHPHPRRARGHFQKYSRAAATFGEFLGHHT